MTRAPRPPFIRFGSAAGHDAVFIGPVALPAWALLWSWFIGIIVTVAVGTTSSSAGNSEWSAIAGVSLFILLGLGLLFGLTVGIAWLVRTIREMNGGRL